MRISLHCIVAAGLWGVLAAAHASEVAESEPNHPIASAEELVFSGSSLTVSGYIEQDFPCDLDFYKFQAQAGDVVTLDIDQGWGGTRNVDTNIALFKADDNFTMLRESDDASRDEGSDSGMDARIDNVTITESGHYIVGVSSYPRYFEDGGVVGSANDCRSGDYQLVISGVTTPIQHIAIEIKPGSRKRTAFHPRSRGKIPVALLSSRDFDASQVDEASLTFGATGYEQSLKRCGGNWDVNRDGLPDLICLFKSRLTGFEPGDLEGVLRGRTLEGREFEGRGPMKVLPPAKSVGAHKVRHHRHHHHRHDRRGHRYR